MNCISRLTKRVEPHIVTLKPNWRNNFKPSFKADPNFSDDLLMSVEGWLKAHVMFVKEQREILAPANLVIKVMRDIAKQVAGTGLGASSDVVTENILKYRSDKNGQPTCPHNVALDWIAAGLPGANLLCDKNRNPAHAERCLKAALRSANGISQLRNSVARQLEHFSLGPELQRRRLKNAQGLRLSDGSIFTYMPDPRQKPYAKPEVRAQYILAAALRDIYRCTGSPPYVPRNGNGTSPFLRFLEAVRCSLPNGFQFELVSPARCAEIDEKKNGPGTLERYKATLYHPGCWRS